MLYPINEIFYSIQCEGYYTGTPAIFIRLAGCNLRCEWCDTDYSEKMKMTPAQIIKVVFNLWKGRGEPSVILTGGEPTIHNLMPLLDKLRKKNIFIAIETNGTADLDNNFSECCEAGLVDWLTVSPKNLKSVTDWMIDSASEIKIVFDKKNSPNKYIKKYYLEADSRLVGRLFVQPCSENYRPAVDFVLNHPQWRLSVQIQKIIGVR